MGETAPNASHHFTEMAIKGDDLARNLLAQPLVGIRQTNFEDGNEISSETDEGHTGVSNLDMGSYRTNAESKPTWEDGIRYGQGLEDYMYLMLCNDTIEAYDEDIEGVFKHHFELAPDNTKDLPLATIYHGFQATPTDGRVFNNSMLNEMEVTLSSTDKPSVKPTFISDYNIVNTINPSRHLRDNHLKYGRTVLAPYTQVFIGAVGATPEEMLANPIDCFIEASWNLNHNAESQACHDDAFGENTKTMGTRELTGSIQMPWVARTKYFETEYECYEKYGHIVSEEITQKQVWYRCHGGNIHRFSSNNTLRDGETLIGSTTVEGVTTYEIATGIPYSCLWKFPVVEVTSVTSTKSGSDAKDLTFEWKNIEQPTQSYMTCDIVSDLSALHIDTVGVARSTVYPNASQYPEFAPFAAQ